MELVEVTMVVVWPETVVTVKWVKVVNNMPVVL